MTAYWLEQCSDCGMDTEHWTWTPWGYLCPECDELLDEGGDAA